MHTLTRLFLLGVLSLTTSAVYAQSCDNAVNPITNCSFESGDFTGWTIKDMTTPFQPVIVTGTGVQYDPFFFLTDPTDGVFVALTGFDGIGPDTIEYSQDVTLPATAESLTFDYRAAWLLDNGATVARTFHVEIQPGGGGTALLSQTFLTPQPNEDVEDTGALQGSMLLDSVAGQSVRILFIWTVPETYTGAAQVQLDNVNITAAPTPPTPPQVVPTLSIWSLGLLVSFLGIIGGIGARFRKK